VLSEIRGVLTGHPKIEANTARARLTEVTTNSINVEVVCYVLTRDFDEFATAREDLLLRIMKFVEESGTNLASPSQTLYLSGDSASKKYTIDAAVKKETDSASAVRSSPGRSQSESAGPNRPRNTGDNAGKDD